MTRISLEITSQPTMHIRKSACLTLLLGLAGCASLPASGPTGAQIEKTASVADAAVPITLKEVVAATDLPAPEVARTSDLAELAPPPTDMIGPGDVLDITIYEAGVTLFAGGASAGRAGQVAAASPGVQAQTLPPSRVNDSGDILIPYAGRLHVLGRTVSEVEAMIRNSLKRVSQNPQVSITVSQAITNSVIVGGEVSKPGRLVLQTNRETLSDVIALAGGYRGSARDLTLRITRSGRIVDLRLGELIDNPALDIRAYPGDRFLLINNPRTYSVLGAPGRVEQLPFTRANVSLAEAIATAGGANPNSGDPAAIFVFRFVVDPQGNEVPVVYHLNMMNAGSYFLAQRFSMKDKDVLYFGNARANQPGKLFQLISQLFTPLITASAVINTVNGN